MAGVYINGLKMPSDGWHKVLMVFSDGRVTDYDGNLVGRAIPVPDHGDLIDVGAFLDGCSKLADDQEMGQVQMEIIKLFMSTIVPTPTIIPSE